MAISDDEEEERLVAAWRAHPLADELFGQLCDQMRRAARSAMWQKLGHRPDEHDVEAATRKAFRQVLEDESDVRRDNPTGFAKTVAKRRGIDEARKVIRRREKVQGLGWKLEPTDVTHAEAAEAAHLELLYEQAEACLEELTANQRDVVDRVVRGSQSLSNWASEHRVSYEAARKTKVRALRALQRCVEAREEAEQEGDSDA